MKHLASTLVFALVFGVGHTAQAPKFTAYGEGASSCGKWQEDKRTAATANGISAYQIDKAWVVGFVSGVGYFGATLKKTDSSGIDAYMDAYCQGHPLDAILDGAEALVSELEKK